MYNSLKLHLISFLFVGSAALSIMSAQEIKTSSYHINWLSTNVDESKENLFLDGGVQYDKIPETHLFIENRPISKSTLLNRRLVPKKTEIVKVSDILKSKITNTEYTHWANIIEIKGQYQLSTTIIPYRKTSNGDIERMIDFDISLNITQILSQGNRNPTTFTSVLADGDIYKISVDKTGIFKIDRAFLESKLGINVSQLNPKKIKIYGNRGGRVPEPNSFIRKDDLAELRIFVSGESDEKFDAGDFILFYAEGADIWKYNESNNAYTFDKNIYDNNNFYFIKIDNQDGLRVSKTPQVTNPVELEANDFDMRQRVEEDLTNLLGSFTGAEGTGKEWYGDYFKTNREKSFNAQFDFSGFNNAKTVEVDMVFAARSRSTSSVSLEVGSKKITKTISSVNILSAESIYAQKTSIRESFLINDSNPVVKISFPSTASESEGWLDYLQIVSARSLTLNNTQLSFRSRETRNVNTASFNLQGYTNQVIWDVTDPFEPKEMTVSGNKLIFNTTSTLKEFIGHNNLSGAFEPVGLGKIANQNLHAMKDEEMIIVYHPLFKDDALRLAQHRTNHANLKVVAADVNTVYNEFSSGRVDPGAIRDMSKLLLDRNPNFKYLLLFGDGSYDYKGIVNGLNKENFVPVYETDQSLDPIEGFPSDDFYGLLGDAEGVSLVGGLDINVGRLPVKTVEESRVVVDKIIHYETSPEVYGDWRLRVGFTADDEDGNTHLRDMDQIARSDENRHPLYNQQKVYLDAYQQISTAGENRYPEANKAINDNMFKGQLSLTYLGHGGPLGWSQERVLTVPDIQSWTNYNSLTIMVTATCSFAAYDDPSVVSPAEYAILNPKGGAIGLFSTTRAVYTSSNKDLTDAVNQLMYKKLDGQAPTLGYILSEGKNRYPGDFFRVNSRKFALLGDPALQVAMPKYNVVTTLINQKDAITTTDTISALEKVTIEGYISDDSGKEISAFNGTIFPTVYDKKTTLTTLMNDPGSPRFPFTLYKNIIFKGSASVVNGKWSFSFYVPKNISYTYGNGRISYYAKDDKTADAGGVFTNIIVGGTSEKGLADDLGPEVDVFMNDESFVFGGMTNADPILLLNLSDDFGINVTGNAIGQDITAILDGDNQNIFILNDFFEAEKDNFRKGKVKFPLNNLSKGTHNIVAKAWDIAGNSAEKRTEFLVAESGDDVLRHVLNYPNPFTTNTFFQFEHDLVNTELDIVVNIYTITGKLVKSVVQTKYSSGFRVNDIGWNGRDDFDSRLGRGIYLYKVSVHSKELNLTRESGFEKLVIL
jgi:Peptidase family C25